MEAGMAIVLYIGVIIAAQSYEATPTKHYPAVALGFFPAVAMMAVLLMPQILAGVGASSGILPMINAHGAALEDAARRTDSWWPIGVYALAGANSGFVITGMLISAITAFLIDRRFKTAAIWCIIAGIVTLLGFHHAYRVQPGEFEYTPRELLVWQRTEDRFKETSAHLDVPEGTFMFRGYRIAGGYFAAAGMMFVIHGMRRRRSGFDDIGFDAHGAVPPPVEVPLPQMSGLELPKREPVDLNKPIPLSPPADSTQDHSSPSSD
jgi:hypothetical protein